MKRAFLFILEMVVLFSVITGSSLAVDSNYDQLIISANDLNNIESLYIADQLDKFLNIYICYDKNEENILDAEVLLKFPAITELWIDEGVVINNFSSISLLGELQVLSLPSQKIEDLSFLLPLTNLEELRLQNNNLRDVSVLALLSNLRTLYLYGNTALYDITPLRHLSKLEVLKLSNTQVVDLSPLEKLTNLSVLEVANCNIGDVKCLAGLNHLFILDIRQNEVENINPLETLKELMYFYCSGNPIYDYSVIAKLKIRDPASIPQKQLNSLEKLAFDLVLFYWEN